MVQITGGCACGAVRYEVREKPIFQLVCHCVDCRKASGSAFAEMMIVASDRLSVLGREPRFFDVQADSGRTMSRGFCETYGSPIMIRKPALSQVTFLQASNLDDPNQFTPVAEVFTYRARAGSKLIDSASRYAKGPPSDVVRTAVAAHFANRN